MRSREMFDLPKPTYAGCGAHIEQVLGDVPKDQRCRCREERSETKGDPTILDRIFGR